MSVPPTLLDLLEREPSHCHDRKRDYHAHFPDREVIVHDRTVGTLTGPQP